MKKANTQKKSSPVFSQPVRALTADEIIKVGGGYKQNSGTDNQSRSIES